MQKIQKIKLWEITPDQKLVEITSNQIPLEARLEDWLESDISVLDPNLLVIRRQVDTDYGGTIDLLCLDSAGDTVIVELKKGKTPREVTAQALDYASWVKNLSYEQLSEIADGYFGSENSLASEFQNKFREELPSELNLNHRSLVVAEEIDTSTGRIVRYLSDLKVPINVVTVQHFRDKDGRELLARVYLIEPEEADAKSKAASKRRSITLAELQDEADKSGIGEMFLRMREGVRDILLARPYFQRVWYGVRLESRGQRALLTVYSVPSEDDQGMRFELHASRFSEFLEFSMEQLLEWLPENTKEQDVTRWAGSSSEEKQNALGLTGSFQSVDEVDRFLNGLRNSKLREQAQE